MFLKLGLKAIFEYNLIIEHFATSALIKWSQNVLLHIIAKSQTTLLLNRKKTFALELHGPPIIHG